MKITSVNNDLVKETAKLLQKKYRNERFLLEGEKCIEEAIESGLDVEYIFVLENSTEFMNFANRVETNDAVLSKISSTESTPKAVAVARKISRNWSSDYKKVILLENIKDAGNLGTILRAAAAFKIDAVVLYGDTVDLYNPKCVRSSVGNLWKVPVFEMSELSNLTVFADYERIATLPKADDTIWLKDFVPSEKMRVMFGSEANGLSNELINFATKRVTIEMSEKVESLNLGVSAAIILYEIM